MPLSPEEIEDHRFREVLRGYDKGQVEAFLVAGAARFRVAKNAGAGDPQGHGGQITPHDVTHAEFDDSLRGYDKEAVRAFLAELAIDLEVPEPMRPGEAAPETGDVSGDAGVVIRSARDIGAAIRAAAEREAEGVRATAAEEAASALEAAWKEMEEAGAAKAAAAEELSAAAATRSEAEREMSQLQVEAARVAEVAAGELQAARALRAEAEVQATAAAEERSRTEAVRAQAEHDADLTAVELGRSRDLRLDAERKAEAARHELTLAESVRSEAERHANDVRASAERDAAATRAAAESRARQLTQRAQAGAREGAALLVDLGRQLMARRVTDGRQRTEAVQRLEDRIFAAVGEIQDEMQHAGSDALALVEAAEQRVRDLADELDGANGVDGVDGGDQLDDGGSGGPTGG